MRQLQLLRFHPPEDVTVFGRTKVKTVRVRSILTSTSGFMSGYDYTLNPYSGCGFGCDYCYAKFFAPTEQGRRQWGRWVSVKSNAVAMVVEACRSGELESGDKVYMSSVTDPYQPIEGKLRLTRGVLEAILESGIQPRLTIQTRSPLVARDIDLFKQFERLRVNVTVTTDSEEMRLRFEPHCPSIKVRLKTLRRLAEAGIRIGVSISPMLPVRDLRGFGERLAELEAEEYATQFLKPGCSRFAAGTDVQAARKAREDGWNVGEYRKARAVLAEVLGSRRPLLEGTEGYAPA
jgi:DNA repair photolyase